MNPKPISIYTFDCTFMSYLGGFESNNDIFHVYLRIDSDKLKYLCFPKNLLLKFYFSKDRIYVHFGIVWNNIMSIEAGQVGRHVVLGSWNVHTQVIGPQILSQCEHIVGLFNFLGKWVENRIKRKLQVKALVWLWPTNTWSGQWVSRSQQKVPCCLILSSLRWNSCRPDDMDNVIGSTMD